MGGMMGDRPPATCVMAEHPLPCWLAGYAASDLRTHEETIDRQGLLR
jgi:hypothetical protein